MAHVEKISIIRYRIPVGKSRSGKTRYKYVNKETPGAKRVERESKYYYAVFEETQGGKRKRKKVNLKVADKQVANARLTDLLRNHELRMAGLLDPFESSRGESIESSKQAYLAELVQKGRDEKYRYQTSRLLARVIRDCEITALGDLTGDKLDSYLKSLSCSARTKNTYRQACFGLMNFMVEKKKLPNNPLTTVSRAEGPKKRKRRALLVAQLQMLLDAARQRPLLKAMTVHRGVRKGELTAQVKPEEKARLERIGCHRALLYLTALHTGLRLGELAALQVVYFELDVEKPFVNLPGEYTKNGKDAVLPLRQDLVADLKSWIAETGRQGTDKVFDIPPYSQISKLLKKDLAAAGIPYKDEKDRYFDFHALRKCTGTYLRRAKIDPALSQKYLRHSDIRLTMEIYNDEDFLDLSEAIKAMPELSIKPPNPAKMPVSVPA